MKVSRGGSHLLSVIPPPTTATPLGQAACAATAGADLTSIYERYFHEVERWLRALGAPPSEIADLAQEVFLIVRRKLGGFDGRNTPGWLYAIAERTWKDHRRRSWFRRFFSRSEPLLDVDPPSRAVDPERAYEVSESWALADKVLATMDERRRVAFVLFEIEGYTGEEIASLQSVPVATVWTRLHKARREFIEGLARLTEE